MCFFLFILYSMRSECIIDELNQKFVADIKWLGHFLFSFSIRACASGIYSFNHHAMIIFIVELFLCSSKMLPTEELKRSLLPVKSRETHKRTIFECFQKWLLTLRSITISCWLNCGLKALCQAGGTLTMCY